MLLPLLIERMDDFLDDLLVVLPGEMRELVAQSEDRLLEEVPELVLVLEIELLKEELNLVLHALILIKQYHEDVNDLTLYPKKLIEDDVDYHKKGLLPHSALVVA